MNCTAKVKFADAVSDPKPLTGLAMSPLLKTLGRPVAPMAKETWKGLKKIEALVDSGSFDHVLPAGFVTNYPVRPSKAQGTKYTVGSGHEIENQGEQPTMVISEEGHQRRMVWQIIDVNRPILSVSRLTEEGDEVKVKVIGFDRGKVKLSIKQAIA